MGETGETEVDPSCPVAMDLAAQLTPSPELSVHLTFSPESLLYSHRVRGQSPEQSPEWSPEWSPGPLQELGLCVHSPLCDTLYFLISIFA